MYIFHQFFWSGDTFYLHWFELKPTSRSPPAGFHCASRHIVIWCLFACLCVMQLQKFWFDLPKSSHKLKWLRINTDDEQLCMTASVIEKCFVQHFKDLCFVSDSSDLYVKEMPLILKNRCSSPIAQLVVNTCGPPIRCNLIFWWCCPLCGSIPALSGGNSTEADSEKLRNYSVSTRENREIIFAFLLVEAAIITVWVRPQKRQNPFVVAESC